MRITHLSLTNFRNYGRLELELPPKATVLFGANAQGKTNILEAIYYLATTKSPHADLDQQLINWVADETGDPVVVGRVVGQVESKGEKRLVELRLIKETQGEQVSFRREAVVNHRKVRLMDLLGNLRVVLFLPQDMTLITGPPADRRRYLDITLCQSDPVYCRQLSAYNKVLEQRNALLRQIAEEGRGRDVLPIFTERLVKHGGHLFARRAAFLADLGEAAQRIHYEELTEGQEMIRLSYLPRMDAGNGRRASDNGAVAQMDELADWLQAHRAKVDKVAGRFQEALESNLDYDLARATTTIGPHRDDWGFWVNGRDLGSYGSRGQQRSAIMALKMGEIKWVEAQTGEAPVLLLDEVLAELDVQRRDALLRCAGDVQQAVFTATSLDLFSEPFLDQAQTMRVAAGLVQSEPVMEGG